MASIAVDVVVSVVAKFLIEEYGVLGDTVRHVEWIEKELRSMRGLLEQVEQHGYGEQEQEFNDWAEKLKDVALDAKNVIETFVIKSVKRKRWGALHWFDKYYVGKQLEHIRTRMRDISHTGMKLNMNISVSVQAPAPAVGEEEEEAPTVSSSSSGPSSTAAEVVVVAMNKLDHILSQNLITSSKVIEIVEQVKDGLKDMQNSVSSILKKSTNERENVWLEEVEAVSTYTAAVAENFIVKKEKWSKMGGRFRKKVLYLYERYVLVWEFEKNMKYIRSCEIGDSLQRGLTYGVVGQLNMINGTTPRSTVPVPHLSVENLIISELIPFSISFIASLYVPDDSSRNTDFLFVVASQAFEVVAEQGTLEPKHNIVKTTRKMNTKEKKGRKRIAFFRELIWSIFFYTSINLPVFILSSYLPLHLALLFQLSFPLYDVIVWIVKLCKSMDKNLQCIQRDLALMFVFLCDIENEQGLNERQKVWIDQLRVVAQNGKSLLDTAASFSSSCLPKGMSGCWRRRIKFAMDINCFLQEILDVLDIKIIYGIANIIQQGTQQEAVVCSSRSINIQDDGNSSAMEDHPAPEPAASSSSYQLVTGLKQEVQSIRREQELMYALFLDVLDMTEIDRRSRIWVEQMQGIANDIGSVIYQYDAKLKNKSILTYTFKYWTRRVICEEINAIRNKIEDTSRRRRAYGLVQFRTHAESSSSSTVPILRGTTQLSLFAKESSIVGFDDDAQVLMARLLSDEKRCCIAWIVGIGGTGKTTLARLIFEDNDVAIHFECRLWVSIPSNSYSNFMPQQLLEEIAKEAANQFTPDLSCNHDVLQTLARKKYLIVIDGIEETSQVYLDTLKDAIPDMSTGSRLLLTSRNANSAQHSPSTTTNFVHPLQLLDDETSWVLFMRHLKVDISPAIMKFGREIVIKCGGLPSQILKMSHILSHKDVTHEECSNVLDQDQIHSWSETVNAINKRLPVYLTGCLSYFELFPAEFGVPVRRLVALWVAEERVHHGEDQEPPEKVAEHYLRMLVDQNLVQIAKRKHNGKVKTCRLPYALRQLWWPKANDSIFLKSQSTSTDSNAEQKESIIRWVSDHLNTDHICYNHIHGDNTRNNSATLRTYYQYVRSFLSFDTREGSKPGQEVGYFMKECISSNCFLQLRVLDLERVYKPKLPKSIAELSQLRYLGLRWTYLESLPPFISRLLKLQTLDLKHTYIHTLPHSIWLMDLRHLFLSETFHSRFPPQQKDHFSGIRFLLPQLRDNFLHDLKTLWGLFVDEETPVKNSLDRLVNITKLGLACQQMSLQEDAMIDQLEAVADWIAKLEHLKSLRLKSRDEQGKPWMLHLKSFHVDLTDMYLLGILSSSSILSQFPLSLVELTLSHSKLMEDPLQILEAFPKLQTLCLHADSYIGKTMVCKSKSFPQLHFLKLWKLELLEEWKLEPGALPCLRQLEIRSCPRLQMLPDGLKHVKTLLELKLTNMPMEITAEAHNIPPNCQVVQTNFQ